MPKTTLYSRTGEAIGEVELPEELFAAPINTAVLHQVVTAQLAGRHLGTHDTKKRGEVSGGGKKPYRQKGTGRARQGSTRSPQFAGGGVVFGPHPRSYAQRLPRQMRRLALVRRPDGQARRRRHPRHRRRSGSRRPRRATWSASSTLSAGPRAAS